MGDQIQLPMIQFSLSVMGVDDGRGGGGTSTTATTGSTLKINIPRSRRQTALYEFTQQKLPACKPVLTPAWVISTFLVLGVAFIPVGIITLRASKSVIEIVDRYDAECVPEAYRSNKVAYIKDSSISKNCTRFIKVNKHMKSPIYMYYQIDNYYQNHRRYVKSRSDEQLLHGINDTTTTSSCKPEEEESNKNNGGVVLPIVPCGLIAWSLFNDSYTLGRRTTGDHKQRLLNVSRKNIAWKSDRDHKFGKQVYPFNFQNGTFIGGGHLDPAIPLSEQEDLMVWMRTSALPSFRKLYGRIDEDLDADEVIVVKIKNNYNTYSLGSGGGKKFLILSTSSSWLGGKNNFLGLAYLFVGSSSVFMSFLFLLLHLHNQKKNYSSSSSSSRRFGAKEDTSAF